MPTLLGKSSALTVVSGAESAGGGVPSSFKTMTASGGSVKLRLSPLTPHASGSLCTPPRLPTPLPPYSVPSLLSSSR